MTEQIAARRDMANAIRALAMDAVQQADSGHPGMPMGMADVATVLFTKFLKFDASEPHWPDRDRFILSAGHGSMLLYGLLHLTGYADMTLDELKRFRQLGSRTAGHPEHGHAKGIETTTGPLGQGIGNAVGMALAERLLAAQFGADLVDHRTYAICGDGCLMEGISHEAISLAGHLRLAKLTLLWDDNSISIDGSTDLAVSDDQVARFKASGWNAEHVDGHDTDAVAAALSRAQHSDRPSFIACRTTIAFGAPTKAGEQVREKFAADAPKLATRQCSNLVIEALAPVMPELVGGSADLTGSNLTKAKSQKPVKTGDFAGNYIYYGVREHGMVAAMNGIAVHGGLIPYGSTYLIFTDYCRPAIRLAALMKQRVIYVMTHDSIGLGEDGPTHQPVEQLAALRAIPNLLVLRPADGVETAECWALP